MNVDAYHRVRVKMMILCYVIAILIYIIIIIRHRLPTLYSAMCYAPAATRPFTLPDEGISCTLLV